MNIAPRALALEVQQTADALAHVVRRIQPLDTDSTRALARLAPEILDALDCIADTLDEGRADR